MISPCSHSSFMPISETFGRVFLCLLFFSLSSCLEKKTPSFRDCKDKQSCALESRKVFAKQFPDEVVSGYSWPQHLKVGEEFSVYFHSDFPEKKVTIRKVLGVTLRKDVGAFPVETRTLNTLDKCSIENGCDWQPSATIKTSSSWGYGLFEIETGAKAANSKIQFSIQPPEGKTKPVLVLNDWATHQAYNLYGGSNLYYSLLKDNRILQQWKNQAFHDGPLKMSFKRPLAAFFLAPRDKGFWADPKSMTWGLEWLDFLKGNADIIQNTHLEELSQDVLKSYDVIVAPGVQEYLTPKTVERLKAYVRNGGYLIISGTEFALRFIHMDPQRSFLQYFHHPGSEKLLDKPEGILKNHVPPTYASSVSNPLTFFGAGFHRGLALTTEDELFVEPKHVNKSHPYFKNMDWDIKEPLGRIKPWALGTLIKKEGDRYCLDIKEISCDQVSVLAHTRIAKKQYEDTCCRKGVKHSREYWGDDRFVIETDPDWTYIALMEIRQGKGRVLIVPNRLLADPNKGNGRVFYQNILDSLSRRKDKSN